MTTNNATFRGPARRIYVKSVGSFVPRLAQKAFEKYGFSTVALLTDWPAIAGSELGRYTRPERLKWPRMINARAKVDESDVGRPGATLILRVDPARALEVQYGSAQLAERINSYFGYNAIASIRILQAPVEAPAKPHAQASSPPVTASKSTKPPASPSSTHSRLKNKEKFSDKPSSDSLIKALERLQASFDSTAA